MKVLMIFVDMLGGEYMNLTNPQFSFTSMDELIKEMGGYIAIVLLLLLIHLDRALVCGRGYIR